MQPAPRVEMATNKALLNLANTIRPLGECTMHGHPGHGRRLRARDKTT